MMWKRGILILFILILTPIIVEANECTIPTNNQIITQKTNLCQGEYNLKDGITVENTTLKCNNTVLKGEFSNTGITAKDKSVIKNCIIKHYSIGIEKENTVVLENNNLKNNTEQTSTIQTTTGYDPITRTIKIRQKDNPEIRKKYNIQLEEYQKALSKTNIKTTSKFNSLQTTYNITITPQKQLNNLTTLVHIPRSITQNPSLITHDKGVRLNQRTIKHTLSKNEKTKIKLEINGETSNQRKINIIPYIRQKENKTNQTVQNITSTTNPSRINTVNVYAPYWIAQTPLIPSVWYEDDLSEEEIQYYVELAIPQKIAYAFLAIIILAFLTGLVMTGLTVKKILKIKD